MFTERKESGILVKYCEHIELTLMKNLEYLLLPQVGPKKVGAQLHLYPLTLSTHVPPLRQGFEAHSSILTSHLQKNSFQCISRISVFHKIDRDKADRFRKEVMIMELQCM